MQYRTTSYAEGVFDTYWFEKNLQGDIVAIYNNAGTLLVTYTYDALGYQLSTQYYNSGSGTAVQYNPFRYRGYYRDSETGFYYLNSRYYDPNTGRFLNADSSLYHSLIGYNLFAYCNNNPVVWVDYTGKSATELLKTFIPFGGVLATLEPTFIGELLVIGGTCIIVGVAVIETSIGYIQNLSDIWVQDDAPQSITEGDSKVSLPNQGEVSEIPEAPPVDASKQGKHVIGHKNNIDPDKSTWEPGETGVRETQEAWLNGKDVPGRQGKVRIGQSSDGRSIRVHIDGKGRIHGYPIFP